MRSVGPRAMTTVVVVTMIFAPVMNQHRWLYRVVGVSSSTSKVACQPEQPCPATKPVIRRVYLEPSRATAPCAEAAGCDEEHPAVTPRGTPKPTP